MLNVSLVLSLILLVTAIFAARSAEWAAWAFGICGFLLMFGTMLFMTMLVAVWCQFLTLAAVVAILNRFPGRGPRLALPVCLTVTAVIYGIVGWYSLQESREYDRRRQQFPYESVAERVPEPAPAWRTKSFRTTMYLHLDRFESRAAEVVKKEAPERERSLLMLHESTLTRFVNAPGFGVTRLRPEHEVDPAQGLRDAAPVPQPVPRASPDGDPVKDGPIPSADGSLFALHQDGVLDFANPAGFGYAKDRRHVAGFQAHGFSKVPGPAERWRVETVDLVGLLRHPEPLAYVSADLPRMDELRSAPTRPLDSFETAGLEQLRQGEDLVIGPAGESLRMLGSVRSAKQCVDCHGGSRGDLLGAFSYVLRRREP